MKKMQLISILYSVILITSLLSIALFTGCGGGGDDGGQYQKISVSDTYAGTGDMVFSPSTAGNVDLSYSLDLGGNTKKVFFVFTNSKTGKDVAVPELMNINSSAQAVTVPPIRKSSIPAGKHQIADRGKPEATAFYDTAKELLRHDAKRTYTMHRLETGLKGPLKAYAVGTTSNLNDDRGNPVPATVRKVVAAHGKTLVLWVANTQWVDSGGGLGTGKINQALADEMANAFLTSGDNNDIYEWITGIFGAEWGAHTYTNLIAVTHEIHILLYDIDNDNSTTGGTLGFFHPRDTFIAASHPDAEDSNERIMFYMDSVLFATNLDWKAELISTLAHEFQHVIHWYQKDILRNGNSTTWLNEMCSLAAEDFAADKIRVNGPRGVLYSDYTAGAADNENGRLPLFNYYNDAPLTEWLDGNDVLISYSVAYAFGAYLARNHGGAQLFRNIVQSNTGDHSAVENAVSGYSFSDLLRQWGVSVVLSDKTAQLPGLAVYGYNRDGDGKFTSTLNSITYNLGSINLYNYDDGFFTGPYYYSLDSMAAVKDYLFRGSNTYVYAGNLTGVPAWTFRMNDGVSLTVIVRD